MAIPAGGAEAEPPQFFPLHKDSTGALTKREEALESRPLPHLNIERTHCNHDCHKRQPDKPGK